MNAGADGTFIVRGGSAPGSYVICIKEVNGTAVNYLIKSTAEGYHFADYVFNTVPEIVDNYLVTPFLAESGVRMKLSAPVPGCEDFFSVGESRCEALFDFAGAYQEDLPFKKGETLVIKNPSEDPNWWLAQNKHGKVGQIPANYVKLSNQTNACTVAVYVRMTIYSILRCLPQSSANFASGGD